MLGNLAALDAKEFVNTGWHAAEGSLCDDEDEVPPAQGHVGAFKLLCKTACPLAAKACRPGDETGSRIGQSSHGEGVSIPKSASYQSRIDIRCDRRAHRYQASGGYHRHHLFTDQEVFEGYRDQLRSVAP